MNLTTIKQQLDNAPDFQIWQHAECARACVRENAVAEPTKTAQAAEENKVVESQE